MVLQQVVQYIRINPMPRLSCQTVCRFVAAVLVQRFVSQQSMESFGVESVGSRMSEIRGCTSFFFASDFS